MSALTLDALDHDGLISFDDGSDPWSDLADVMAERADADREAFMDDCDAVDEPWMLDTHGGPAAVGFAVGERVLWIDATRRDA